MTAPTRRLLEAIDALAMYRREFEATFPAPAWTPGSHADLEMLAFCRLAIADVCAVEVLGRADVHFVIPATAAARAAYEAIVTGAWMVAGEGAAERDRRWLSLYEEEKAHWQRLIQSAVECKAPEAQLDLCLQEAQRVEAILDAAKSQLREQNHPQPTRFPEMDARLTAIGEARHFFDYRIACEYVHPATRALSTVRDVAGHGSGTAAMTYEWRTRPRAWTAPITLAAEAMALGVETVAAQLEPRSTLDRKHYELFNAILERVRALEA